MNRDELLDKLAMELECWPSRKLSAYQVPYKLPNSAKWARSGGRFCVQSLCNPNFQITKNCWLQRRTELINEPDDSEAPPAAIWKLQGPSGKWHWAWQDKPYIVQCEVDGYDEVWSVSPMASQPSRQGAIPAGHHWQDTFTEVNRMTTTAHEDQYAPEPPHEADARMQDAQLAADMRPNANSILSAAAQHMQERASTYDKPKGERSMGATVNAFASVTGHSLTEEQGWLFMQLLKAVRSQQGSYRADSYEDGAAYAALAGEAAAKERS